MHVEFNVVPRFYYALILLVEKGDLSHKTNEIYIQQSTRLEPNMLKNLPIIPS